MCPRCGERFASAMHVRDLKRFCRNLDSTTLCREQWALAGSVPGLQAKNAFARATEIERGSAWLRLRTLKRFSKNSSGHISITSRKAAGQKNRSIQPEAGQNALLLLRTTMRHSTEGSREKVIGFEPWEEFPFNRGKLCPKGVKRYLQSNHQDRLLDPLMRADQGFREGLGRSARFHRQPHSRHPGAAWQRLGGGFWRRVAHTEKSYLMGKFARVALGTRHIDYNGRLCMVSAGTAYKLAFDVDRSPIPWSDIPKAQVLFVIGANIGECYPITTDYVWRCRDNGGKLIVADPRMTPISRNADLYLPLRPGTDLALLIGCST